MEIRIRKGMYQDRFLLSESKFPAIVSAVGTGKTLCLLLKVVDYCERYPGTSALVVRREFTDLKDSTMKDFENYFPFKIGSDKNCRLPNGSLIMFRHAAEIQVLKNINLGICGIEQAEEFDDDTQFQFLRDRLRQNNGASVRPLCIIANANGHNWVWKLWINGADVETIDADTGQAHYRNGEYDCTTANTFANEHNLAADFVADMRRKETEAPNHYAQYVMNSFEQMSEDDFVFNFNDLMACKKIEWADRVGYGHKIFGFDIARYGNDKCAAIGICQLGALAWDVCYVEQWDHRDLDYTTGRIQSTAREQGMDDGIIDIDGLGSGPFDVISAGRRVEEFQGARDIWHGFRNSTYSKDANKDYGNPRTAAAFKLKEYIAKGWIRIRDEGLIGELMAIRYRYANDGRRILVSKEEMRNKYKIKSPNMADGLIMAASLIGVVKARQDRMYVRAAQPISREEDLFQIAGIR